MKNGFTIILIAAVVIVGAISFSVNAFFKTPDINVAVPNTFEKESFTGLEKGTTPEADTQFIFYADTQCPYTAQMKGDLKEIYTHYNGEVNFVFKHFPLENIHPQAVKAGEAVECAADQNLRWEYFFHLLDNPLHQDIQSLKAYANELGLNQEEFDHCLDSGIKYSIVEADFQDGLLHQVPGTPTMFVGKEELREFKGVQSTGTLGLAIREAQ